MKHHTALPLLAALALLTSCSSNITNLRQQISPTYQTFNVEADERAAFDASLVALTQMGFTITSSGAAQGKIEAINSVAQGDFSQSPARQVTASVRFTVAPDNATAIQILFTEIVDSRFSGREGLGTRQPLASSPLYAVFGNYAAAALKK